MADRPLVFDDLARLAGGAATALSGAGAELKARLRDRLGEAPADSVTREEFEAVRQLAANARAEAERLAERLAALEARLGGAA